MALIHHYTGRAVLVRLQPAPVRHGYLGAVVAVLLTEPNLIELSVKPREVFAVVLLETVDNVADRCDELAAGVRPFALKHEVTTDVIDDPTQKGGA